MKHTESCVASIGHFDNHTCWQVQCPRIYNHTTTQPHNQTCWYVRCLRITDKDKDKKHTLASTISKNRALSAEKHFLPPYISFTIQKFQLTKKHLTWRTELIKLLIFVCHHRKDNSAHKGGIILILSNHKRNPILNI